MVIVSIQKKDKKLFKDEPKTLGMSAWKAGGTQKKLILQKTELKEKARSQTQKLLPGKPPMHTTMGQKTLPG